MGSRTGGSSSKQAREKQIELSLSICTDALKAIAANGDLHSAWSARKALNNVQSKLRRANV